MTEDRRQKLSELAVVTLVSAAHFWSHFYVLAIPSSLPLMREEFGASNVALGSIMAAFALMSASWQFPMGVLSDRYGARAFFIGGLFVLSAAMFFQSLAPVVPVMIGIAVVAGIADSVFHPADYTIITAKVRGPWLGRSYAVHTFSGFLGFAAAPTVMSFLFAHGTWRDALAIVGIAGFATAILLLVCRKLFAGVTYPPQRRAGQQAEPAKGLAGLGRFLLSPPLLVMFVFYVAATLSGNGIQNFGNSALIDIYDVDIVLANTALALYLWGTAAGVLSGGIVADRMSRFDTIAAGGYLAAAVLLCLAGLAILPFFSTVAALFFAGFMIGAVMPARDLMVRSVAPPGSIGKAFGYVSSGFGVGGFIGPLFFGTMMDLDFPQLIFFVSAGMMLVTIAVALFASHIARRSGVAGLKIQPAE